MELVITTREELEDLVKTSTAKSIKEYFTKKESNDSQPIHTTVKEAAKRLKVSELTVRNYIKRGTILAKKVGNRVLIDTASIDKALFEVKSLKYKR
nr:helix-turn-helix domain-containing protein [Nonlabens ulvanivorans]